MLAKSRSTVNGRIFLAAFTVAGFTGVVHLASFAKELLIAYHFGTSELLDAFLIAFLLPAFAVGVLAESFSSGFIPTYLSVLKKQGAECANSLFASVAMLALIFLAAAALIVGLFAPGVLKVLGSGFSAQNLALAQNLLWLLLPVLPLYGIVRVWSALLNAQQVFGSVALVPGVTPLVIVAVLWLFSSQLGIYSLASGTLLGATAEVVILLTIVARKHLPLLPAWSGQTREVRAVLRQYAPVVFGAIMMSGTILVDQAMAAMLEPGSVSALSFGNKVITLVLSLSAMALGTAALPHLSAMVAHRDWTGVERTLYVYERAIVLLAIPVSAVLFLASSGLVELLFERGAFTASDTALVGQILAYYSLQLPFYMAGILGVRVISACANNSALVNICVVNFVFNVAANYLLMQMLGVSGIALATAFVYAISFVLIRRAVTRSLRRARTRGHEAAEY